MQNFFHVNDKSFERLSDALDGACEGLIYISETDAPVVPFVGQIADRLTVETVLGQLGKDKEIAVEEREFVEWFERLTRERDWHGAVEMERAKKFLELQKLLEENLVDRKVYRLGAIRIEIYALGRDADGRVTGVSTFAVET